MEKDEVKGGRRDEEEGRVGKEEGKGDGGGGDKEDSMRELEEEQER